MPNGKSPAHTLELEVPTYLPLSEAANKYNLSENMLTQLIQAGKIEAVRLPSGEVLVSANNDPQRIRTKDQIIVENFVHLRRQPITISQAVKDYDVPDSTIRNWVSLKYIDIVDASYPMKIDEAEVAYCAQIYHERGGKSGARLFDENGNPYQLKHPELAEYRRKKKQGNSI